MNMDTSKQFTEYIRRLDIPDAEVSAITEIHRACFEQIANDTNPKPNGCINRRPSLMGEYSVGFDNSGSEWFPKKTVSDELANKAKESQMGYRIGTWNCAGRTVLGKSTALSTENVYADVGGDGK